MSFDPKCYELARHFVPDGTSEKVVTRLAQHIQDSIEAEVNAMLEELSIKNWRAQ